MLTELVFFAASKKVKNGRSKNSYLLRDLMNFNKIFWKNVTYDNVKSDQKTKLYTVLFLKQFLACNGCFGSFSKIKKGPGASFWSKMFCI